MQLELHPEWCPFGGYFKFCNNPIEICPGVIFGKNYMRHLLVSTHAYILDSVY